MILITWWKLSPLLLRIGPSFQPVLVDREAVTTHPDCEPVDQLHQTEQAEARAQANYATDRGCEKYISEYKR